ncbi:MAG: hypothetical protein WCY01_12700, partial [Alkalispirochaeta sp.]
MEHNMARNKAMQTRHVHNGIHYDLMPRTSKKGLVWYIGVIDETGKKRYSTVRSTKQTVKQRALEVAAGIIEKIAETPVDRVNIRAFIDEMW